jgi:hypothetical protein
MGRMSTLPKSVEERIQTSKRGRCSRIVVIWCRFVQCLYLLRLKQPAVQNEQIVLITSFPNMPSHVETGSVRQIAAPQ